MAGAFPQVWLRSTFQNVHTCQLSWHSAAPSKTSVDHSLSPFLLPGAHAEGEGNSSCFSCTNKQFSTHAMCIFNSLLKYATSFQVMISCSAAKPLDYCIVAYIEKYSRSHRQLYLIIHSDMWSQPVYRCGQWHVLSNPPAKNPRSSVFSLWRS